VGTGGTGGNPFIPEAKTIVVAAAGGTKCAFVANGGSDSISGIQIANQPVLKGTFSASTKDVALSGLATSPTFLYASYADSYSIAAFQMSEGCQLSFAGDVAAKGIFGGYVLGMALHGSILVVAYGDYSIESFNVSGGIPVANGDLQIASGRASGLYPVGVDITKNGQYAVFSDNGGPTAVEVSNISSGKLEPPVLFTGLGPGTNATSILISPNDNLAYLADALNAQVTAVRISETTGKATFDCISSPLKGSGNSLTNLALDTTIGTGEVVFAVETYPSSIGMLSVATPFLKACTLTETAGSPVSDPDSSSLRSIAVYPPRTFLARTF
jgi:hypothetical protein